MCIILVAPHSGAIIVSLLISSAKITDQGPDCDENSLNMTEAAITRIESSLEKQGEILKNLDAHITTVDTAVKQHTELIKNIQGRESQRDSEHGGGGGGNSMGFTPGLSFFLFFCTFFFYSSKEYIIL